MYIISDNLIIDKNIEVKKQFIYTAIEDNKTVNEKLNWNNTRIQSGEVFKHVSLRKYKALASVLAKTENSTSIQ